MPGVERKLLLLAGVGFAVFFSRFIEIEPFGIARLRSWTNSGNIRIFLAGQSRTFGRFAVTPFQPALVLLLISFDLRLFTSALISCRPRTFWHR